MPIDGHSIAQSSLPGREVGSGVKVGQPVDRQAFGANTLVGSWSKLGAEYDAQISVDYKGSAVANGGFVITLRDLARFSQMVLDDGYYNGQQIVPSGWIDDIRFNGKNSAWKPTSYAEIWPDGFYRNQWYVTNDDQGSFFAVGVNG